MNAIKIAEPNIRMMDARSINVGTTSSNSDICGLQNVLFEIDYLLSGHSAFQVNIQ